jgi:hypothetical protein
MPPAVGTGLFLLFALLLAAALDTKAAAPPPLSEGAKKAVYKDSPEDMEKLAAKNSLEFFRIALKWSDDQITDYTCQFQKQEKIDGTLQKVEVMRMKFRVKVFSAYFKWVGEEAKGQEALYVEDQNDGKVAAHPGGLLGKLVRRVNIEPTGKLALKHSRRPLTFAGMANMLRLIVPHSERAQAAGDLKLTYEGIRDQEGRPAYVFKRILPNRNDYPCPVLIVYIDREFLACVRTDAYDWDGSLQSQYIYSDFQINPGLKDADFDINNDNYGFKLF